VRAHRRKNSTHRKHNEKYSDAKLERRLLAVTSVTVVTEIKKIDMEEQD
jgi:hypothetical protein